MEKGVKEHLLLSTIIIPLLEKRVGKQIHVWVLASAAIVTSNFSVWEAAIVAAAAAAAANNVSSSLCVVLWQAARDARADAYRAAMTPRGWFARGSPLA